MTLWIKVLIVFAIFTMLFLSIVFMGEYLRQSEKEDLQKIFISKSLAQKVVKVDYDSLKNLPIPVQRYFKNVLPDGQFFIQTSRLEQKGKLKISPTSKNWSAFKASQLISDEKVSFLWDAKVNVMPFLYVRVIDSLIDGIGAGKVYLMSVLPIGSDENKLELNSGALYRYLAEAVWHPTALLPQAGVRWEAINEEKAIANFTKFNMSISVEFTFNSNDEIIGVYTRERYGRFGDKYIKYPWEGHFSDYRDFDGIKIPTKGEVGWHLPDGWWLFWKGNIIDAKFEF